MFINYNSFLYGNGRYVPSATLENVVVEKDKIRINFNLFFSVSSAGGLIYYFGNQRPFKVAIFQSTGFHPGNHKFQEHKELFNMARENDGGGVEISKIMPVIPSLPFLSEGKIENKNQMMRAIHYIRARGAVGREGYGIFDASIGSLRRKVIQIPYSTTIDITNNLNQDNKNLSIFVVPYLGTNTVTATNSGKDMLEMPVLTGPTINERIYRNNRIMHATEFYRQLDSGSWWRPGSIWPTNNIHVHQGVGMGGSTHRNSPHPRLTRQVQKGKILDFTIIDQMIAGLTDEGTTSSKKEEKKPLSNYFSKLQPSRDKNETMISCFGMDKLGLLRNKLDNREILYNDSLASLSTMAGIFQPRLQAYVRKYPTGQIISRAIIRQRPISMTSASPRTSGAFIQHYEIIDRFTKNMTAGSYYYSIQVEIDIHKTKRIFSRSRHKLEAIRQRLARAIAISENTHASKNHDLPDTQPLRPRTADDLVAEYRKYSERTITLPEYKNMSSAISTLYRTQNGRKKIILMIDSIINKIKSFISQTNVSKPTDQPSGKYSPQNPNSSKDQMIRFEHDFKSETELIEKRFYPHSYGVSYAPLPNSGITISKGFLTQQLGSLYQNLFGGSISQNFATDVQNMTSDKYNNNLDLNKQRFSYLSPYSYMTKSIVRPGAVTTMEQIIKDNISTLDRDDFAKYNTHMLQYMYYKGLGDGSINYTDIQPYVLHDAVGKSIPLNPYWASTIQHLFKFILKRYIATTDGFDVFDELMTTAIENKKNHDPDDVEGAIPDEPAAPLELTPTDPTYVMLAILSEKIFDDGSAYNGVMKFNFKKLLENASYEEIDSLPNQIKALIKNYDYVSQIEKNPDADSFDDYAKRVHEEFTKDGGLIHAGYVYINFFNLKELQTFEGYETDGVSVFMNKPIYKKLDSQARIATASPGRPIYCRLIDYKNLKFNIPETIDFPIYGENFYIS